MARKKSAPAKAKPPVDEDAPEGTQTAHIRVDSTRDVTDPEHKKLLDKIAALQAKNDALSGKLKTTEQERDALEAAQAQGMLFQTTVQEIPTGKFVEIDQLARYKIVAYKDDGREIRRPVFKKVKVPTFKYKIDMAPSGDVAMKINGFPLTHGAVYTLDLHTLRTVKDIVARTWDHYRNTHKDDENFYRRRDPGWIARNSPAIARGIL